ncbi:MAG TPA: ABC transporter substrate-binding protein [Geminicoccaceae bacterium]
MKRWWPAGVLTLAVVLLARTPLGAELGTIRIGVLQFGTVNWELDVIEHNGLDAKHGFDLEVQGFGNDQATKVALQGGAVDGIVSDWLWVSRQRSDGTELVFVPYSTSVGSLMVPPDSGIDDLADLEGKKIGVAGGPLDKGWLLLQGLAMERHGIDLASAAEPAFGAPPLLNQKTLDGELDAVLNYWHFAARLEARGFERLIGVEEVAAALGIPGEVPQLGYVFEERFADENQALVLAFVAASKEAKALLRTSDAEWERIRPMTKAEDDATFEVLKKRFREGIPEVFGETERASAAELYAILAELGGEELVGSAKSLDPGTFWSRLTTY